MWNPILCFFMHKIIGSHPSLTPAIFPFSIRRLLSSLFVKTLNDFLQYSIKCGMQLSCCVFFPAVPTSFIPNCQSPPLFWLHLRHIFSFSSVPFTGPSLVGAFYLRHDYFAVLHCRLYLKTTCSPSDSLNKYIWPQVLLALLTTGCRYYG